MYQLARLSAPEVARSLRFSRPPARLLDLAGGHGWFAAEICKRHPGLTATVLDLPGSAAVGRRIIADAGMSGRVVHVEGDMLKDDLGGPYDAVLAFQIIHHLMPEQNAELFGKVRKSLIPGGKLAILDYFAPQDDRKSDASSLLGLHFYLTSAAGTYSLEETTAWLNAAGFESIRQLRLRSVPIQILVEAACPGAALR
jgi:cyclopropane fatty-acyl-phospholipid synthase-like methyltransferase